MIQKEDPHQYKTIITLKYTTLYGLEILRVMFI